MKQARLIAIDFDDTLCLTEEATFYLENHVAQSMGHTPMTRESHKQTWGMPLQEAILQRIPNIDPQEFMIRLAKSLPLFVAEGKLDTVSKENLRTLQKLKDVGKLLTVVTSRTLSEVEHLLEPNHELHVFLDGFYHKDKTIYHKPDPRVFDMMLQDFMVQPNEVVYIGDAPTDAKAATEAGMHFIAILESGIRTKEDFSSVMIDAFVDTFSDVERLLLGDKN